MPSDTSVGMYCYTFDLLPLNYLVVESPDVSKWAVYHNTTEVMGMYSGTSLDDWAMGRDLFS